MNSHARPSPLPDPALVGLAVDAYRNLHAGGYSLRCRKTGRVVAHVEAVALRDAEFVVQAAGRARVLTSGRKQVHAFVRGFVAANPDPCAAGAAARRDGLAFA